MSSYTDATSGAENRTAEDINIFKKVLNKHLKVLIDDLSLDIMLDHLTTVEELKDTEIKDLRNPATKPSDRRRHLIETIKEKGNACYRAFLDGLKANKQDHLYKLLDDTERQLKREQLHFSVTETSKKPKGSGAESFVDLDGGSDSSVTSLRQPDSTPGNSTN